MNHGTSEIIKIKHTCFMDILTKNHYYCHFLLRSISEFPLVWTSEDTQNLNMCSNDIEKQLDFLFTSFKYTSFT
jgi:hypothetical protein